MDLLHWLYIAEHGTSGQPFRIQGLRGSSVWVKVQAQTPYGHRGEVEYGGGVGDC